MTYAPASERQLYDMVNYSTVLAYIHPCYIFYFPAIRRQAFETRVSIMYQTHSGCQRTDARSTVASASTSCRLHSPSIFPSTRCRIRFHFLLCCSLSFFFFTFLMDMPIVIVLLSLPGHQTRRMTRSSSSTQASFDDDDEKDSRGRRKERPQQLDLIDFSDKTSLFVNDKVSITSFYNIPCPSWIIGNVYTRNGF